MQTVDLDKFRRSGNSQASVAKPQRLPRHRSGEWFIQQIPGTWLGRAARLPGKTLHIALAAWFAAGLTRGRQGKLTGQVLGRFGVGRDAAYHGLRRLEAAGLVSVIRKPGRCPLVTVQEVPGGDQ